MEYFEFDYTKIKKDLTFKNYENFISNGKFYKHYLFDLGLMRYDKNMPNSLKTKSENIIKLQKLLSILPYPLVLGRIAYLYKRNYFPVNMFEREFKTVINLFMFTLAVRALQKGFLKYQSDDVLEEAYKINKENAKIN
jgi:hypothetical protein